MIKLNIVIPIYNVEEYLTSCLSSLLKNKNRYGFEVILVDDCATDSSREDALECLFEYYQQPHNSVFEFISIRNLIIYQTRSLYSANWSAQDTLMQLKSKVGWMNE